MKIYYMRHGEYQEMEGEPTIDTPLSATGIDKTRKSVQELEHKDIRVIYSSQLERSRQTAQIASKQILVDIKIVSDLNERVKGTEEFKDLLNRARSFNMLINESDNNVLVVTHSMYLY